MFKPSKKIAAVLALGMMSSLFVGTGVANAANGVAVSVSRVMSAKDDAGLAIMGTLQIKEDTDYKDAFKEDDVFTITLPSNLKWAKGKKDSPAEGEYAEPTAPDPTTGKRGQGTVPFTDPDNKFEVSVSGNYSMTVKILDDGDTPGADILEIPLYLNFDGVEEGYAYATIDGMDSPVPSGDYAIAQVVGGGTTATATDTFTKGPDTSNVTFSFRLTETAIGTLIDATDRVKFTLPKNINFNDIEVNALGGLKFNTFDLSDYEGAGGFVTFNENKVTISNLKNLLLAADPAVTQSATARGIIEFVANVDITDDADEGAVELDIEGTDDIDDATIKVGTVAEYAVALSVDDPTTILAGQVTKDAGTIVIYENVPDVIAEDRSIDITLPDGVQFGDEPKLSVKKGTATAKISSMDEDSVTIKLTGKNKTTRLKLEIDVDKLNVRADFVGDIVATIDGRAGVEGEVVLATVNAPVEVAVETVSDVKIGYQNQAVADIVITETEAGAMLEGGDVKIELPKGVDFADENVTVEVTDGNLEIKNVKVKSATDKSDAAVSFEVKSESTAKKPGTVTISGLYLNVDRTVAEGEIKAAVSGQAIVQSYDDYKDTSVAAKEYDATLGYADAVEEDLLFDEDEACRIVIANCITPGAAEVVNSATTATSTFVIGSTAAVIAGEESTMPIAPYISNSRTLCPVRYVAYACGIPEANVVWNPDLQTVTLMNNNGTIVQLTIGSTTMLINGVPVIMDVAPEITGGYTFLPARYVANAFGYDAVWEAATQTVTITPIAK